MPFFRNLARNLARAPAQPPAQPPTQSPTQPPARATARPPTQPPSQPPTQPPARATARPPTQPPAQPPTQPPKQPPIQPPTQPLARATARPRSHDFCYKPFHKSVDSIRLLEILKIEPPRSKQDLAVISCRLINTTFQRKPVYEALSYTWGGSDNRVIIFLNDGRFLVRRNLYDALCHLGDKRRQLLWIDAICIDQNNDRERGSQVAIMDYIYSRASAVILWLGIPPIKAKSELHLDNMPMPYPRHIQDQLYQERVAKEQDYESWILQNAYWTRLWIIQEVGLASKISVHIGGFDQSWDEFVHDWMDNRRFKREVKRLRALDNKRRDRHGPSNRLEVLLEDFKYAQCTEAKDKVYGFLGLAHDCQDGFIQVDYNKSLFDIYLDVIKFFCRRRQGSAHSTNDLDRSMRIVYFSQLLQTLLRPPQPDPHFECTDDYVVQVRAAIMGEIFQLGPTSESIVSSASANRQWKASFQDSYSLPADIQKLREANQAYTAKILDMPNWITGNICGISPLIRYSRSIPTGFDWLPDPTKWDHDEHVHNSGSCNNGASHSQSSQRFPASGTHIRSKFLNSEPLIEISQPVQMVSRGTQTSFDDWTPRPKPVLLNPQDTHFKRDRSDKPTLANPSVYPGKPRMFLGGDLLMGLAPAEAQIGDLICTFWNTDVATLLRREKSSGIYRVVGKADLSTGYLVNLQSEYRKWVTPKKGAKTLLIEMDIHTLALLTC
jgi:hypothetical protein